MMKIKHILFLIVLPTLLFTSCDDSDDLTEIFLGKTWKLTQIYIDKGTKPQLATDYWGSEAEKEVSYRLLNEKGTFIIRFDGLETDNKMAGSYTGHATSTDISGDWNADGKNRDFATKQETKTDKDVLGTAFIKALTTAYKYGGDSQGLQIFFTETTGGGIVKKYLLFRVVDE